MVVTEILIEETTKLCRRVIWVDKHESFGDISYIRVSLNRLFMNCPYGFTQ
jgi:hypothetical protein